MNNGGRKDDNGKTRWDLVPGLALEEVAKVYTYGANHYKDWNWYQGMKWSRLYAALIRHLFAFWWKGERNDREHTHHHLASVVFCALSLMTYDLEGRGEDDRITSQDHTPPSPPAPTLPSQLPVANYIDGDRIALADLSGLSFQRTHSPQG